MGCSGLLVWLWWSIGVVAVVCLVEMWCLHFLVCLRRYYDAGIEVRS